MEITYYLPSFQGLDFQNFDMPNVFFLHSKHITTKLNRKGKYYFCCRGGKGVYLRGNRGSGFEYVRFANGDPNGKLIRSKILEVTWGLDAVWGFLFYKVINIIIVKVKVLDNILDKILQIKQPTLKYRNRQSE